MEPKAHADDLRQGEDRPDLDVPAIFVVGFVGTAIVFLIVVLLQAFYYKAQDSQFQEAYAEPQLEVRKVRSEQLDLLSGYSIPEPGKGTIHIPIDRAIEIVAREGAQPEATAPAAPVAPGPAVVPNAQGQSTDRTGKGRRP